MPKRVLILTNRFVPGGPLFHILDLVRQLCDEGDEYEVMVAGGPAGPGEKSMLHLFSYMKNPPVVIQEMQRRVNPVNDLATRRKIIKLIKDFKPDILHSHMAKPGYWGRILGRRLQVPVVVHTFHGHLFEGYFNPLISNMMVRLERYLARKSDAIIAISRSQYDDLVHRYGIAGDDVVKMIPISVDAGRIEVSPEKRKQFREQFHIPDDVTVIGMSGRLVPIKNIDLFIDTLARLINDGGFPVRGVLAGDGPERTRLAERAVQKGLQLGKDLIFTGWIDDVSLVYSGLDMVVLTSLNEGVPFSILEAALASLPVVAAGVGGVPDIRVGLTFDVNKPQEFYDKIVSLLNDKKMAEHLGRAAHDLVDWDNTVLGMVCKIKALYQSLLKQKQS